MSSSVAFVQEHLKADSLIAAWQTTYHDSSASAQSKLLIQIGRVLRFQYPDSAMSYYSKALEIAEASNEITNIARATNATGGIHYVKGEYDFAMESYTKALNIWDSLDHKRGVAVGLNNIALIQGMQEHYDDAIKNHKKSLEMCRENGDSLMIGINLLNLGINYHAKGDQDRALEYFDKAIEIKKQIKSNRGINQVKNLKGKAYLEKKDFKKAKEMFNSILLSDEEINKWELVYAHAGMAELFLETGKNKKSIDHALKASALAKELGAKWDLQEITRTLAKNYAAIEQWQKAYEYHTLHKKYSDSVFNERKENQINYQRLKREEMVNKNLAKDNELKQLQLTKKQHQMWAFIGAIFALIVVAIVLFRNVQLKTQLNRKLRKKNLEIEKKNKQLSDLNTTKDILFRVMAHDLKNPISLVISYTEMMEEDFEDIDKEELLDFIKKLNQTSHEGLLLLENLMDWARSQTGAINVTPEKVNLCEVIRDNMNLVSHNASAKNITVNNKVEEDCIVKADINMTSAIIRNLLTNAIKFTHMGGWVDISAEKKEQFLKIEFKDNGVGMDDEQLNNLFRLNHKKSTAGTNREKGTGLGLIICKDFAVKQGGDISVESEVDKGSAFTLLLPLP